MKDLAILKVNFEDDRKANDFSIREYKEAREYYHGYQLPNEILGLLAQRGQPPSYENLYRMIIDKILGYKSQNIQEIKITGRQEEDKALANLLQDLIRVLSQNKNFEKEILKRDFELILGLSVVEVWIDKQKSGDMQISIKTVNTGSFLIDKYSTDLNALDARRFHKRLNIELEYAQELFENRVISKNNDIGDSRAEIIESWYKENGKWNRYIWQDSQIIAYEESPFRDGEHPFIISKFYIDHNNHWYGLFRDIKPLQDFINFTENKIANMMGTFKAFYEEGAVLDPNEFALNASMDNAIIAVRDGALKENKIHFVKHNADISALSQKVQEKRNMIKVISGLNEEALGMAVNRQSGIAIAQRRDSGLMGLHLYLKRADDMDRLIYERALSLIEHYYTKEQTFRIVDKKTGERYFSINTNDNNKIKIGHFDLVLATQAKQQGREERFAHWSEMLKTIANIRPDLIAGMLPLMLKDTDSPIVADIEELIAQSEQAQAEQAQAQQQAQQQAEQLQLAQAQASIHKDEAISQKYLSQANIINAQINNPNAKIIQEPQGRINTQSQAVQGDLIRDSIRK